jgi:phage terminase large subunit-like protein
MKTRRPGSSDKPRDPAEAYALAVRAARVPANTLVRLAAIRHLRDLEMTEVGQGFMSMAAPTAELLRLVKSGQLWHGGHPVLRWMASNLSVRQDRAGNLKPDKEKSSDKIDGIAALCNALAVTLVAEPAPYSDGRDLLII